MTAPTFLPWLRRNLAAHIVDVAIDGLAPHDHTSASVSVSLHSTSDTGEVVETVAGPAVGLRGPAYAVGIDAAQVLRCDPRAGTADAESGSFALIEFAAPDLPWRYTPAAADLAGRLQPWLALVVVAVRDGVWLEDRGAQLRPILHVDVAGKELPDLAQSWAWAHVHADDALAGGVAGGVAVALAARSEAFRSRLLCPRRLAAGQSWLACVVPTFEVGRRAGLGEPLGTDLGPAWNATAVDVRLPVYYSWRFATGPGGDFESLVRRLTPRDLPATVGLRTLHASNPGGGLPVIPGTALTLRGALLSPAAAALGTRDPAPGALSGALRAMVNQATAAGQPAGRHYAALRDDPVVGPPAYAATQADRRTVPPEGAPPPWFAEVNAEPVNRSLAGLGAQVVRHDQEALMRVAWRYADAHRRVNDLLGRARFAAQVARLAPAALATLPDADLVQLAAPAFARLPGDAGRTLRGALDDSAIPAGLVSAAMRRACRTVPGFAAVRAVTVPALADPVAFGAAWQAARAPVNAGLQVEPAATVAAGAQARTRPVIAAQARVPVGHGRVPAGEGPVQAGHSPEPAGNGPVPAGNGPATASLAGQVRAALDPAGTIAAMVGGLVTGVPSGGTAAGPTGVPARVTARPRYTTPMYERLRALSPEYLVPGIGGIPDDTLGLLVANQPFVEAFLAGLNHELGREFTWREYPASLRDTWSRRFWDGDADDIMPIGEWSRPLGGHHPPGADAADLVLLIKGTLPRRHPDMRVYCAEAQWDGGRRREAPDGAVYPPLFTAVLAADCQVYGFALSPARARGSTDPAAHPGYFIVLEQRPGACRFGLDQAHERDRGAAPHTWHDLSWAHLAAAGDPLPDFVDVTGPAWLIAAGALAGNGGRDAWGDDAAAMARITLQRPVRTLTHASAMLPEATP